MALRYDSPTWDRLEHLFARAVALSAPRRQSFLDELAVEEPHLSEELATLLQLSSPSSRFFRKLERKLFDKDGQEDTGGVLARFDPLVGTTLGERYRVEAVRGRGGMGTVYRAVDGDSGDVVAVKTLSSRFSSDREGRRRFMREARTMRTIRHPNVCRILDAGETGDATPFLVMPYLEGTILARRLRDGPLPIDEAIDWLTQVCDGLSAIHSAGIVHRDLSPTNMIRTPEDRVIILDFGLAKLAHATLGTRSRELGTLPYMAPEQLVDSKVDSRTDVWALAAIFYEMVTGERAFPGRSITEVRDAILERDPAPLRDVRPEIGDRLSGAVSRALRKQREERLVSVVELAAAAT